MISFLLALLFLTSCNESVKYKTIVIPGQFSIEIPDAMVKSNRLHKKAPLQYESPSEDLFVIGSREDKEKVYADMRLYTDTNKYSQDLNGYAAISLSLGISSISLSSQSNLKMTVINSKHARVSEIEGKFKHTSCYYIYAFYEGKKNFYRLLAWTYISTKRLNKEAMEKMVSSFKVIND